MSRRLLHIQSPGAVERGQAEHSCVEAGDAVVDDANAGGKHPEKPVEGEASVD